MKLFFTIGLIVMTLILVVSIAACAENTPTGQSSENVSEFLDREGNYITVPGSINSILSMGPATTEILVELGFADKIIAIDGFSANIQGLPSGIPQFDMMAPDGEQIMILRPDIIFVPGMTRDAGGDDPFQMIRDAGIPVIFIPTSTSINEIIEDISFLGAIMGAEDKSEEIISAMKLEIEAFRSAGAAITERRTVYFEISPAPWMVSLGRDTFLNEMIEIIGAENIFADMDSWTAIADEAVIAANPDVILTSVDFIDDPIGEIMSRPGWGAITAVSQGSVYFIDTDASNRPSHNIVVALREMAQAVFPEYFDSNYE